MAEQNLKSKAVSGASWVAVEKLVKQVVQFAFGIVLARILAPSDYGVVGMLAIFMAIASTFMDSGFGSALIQKQDRTEKDYCTVFLFNLAVSCAFYVLLFFTSPLIADFYHMPILKDVTRVVALQLIINAFTTINMTRMTIHMKFRQQSLISIVAMLVTGAVGLSFAFNGYGVWALVYQTLAGALMTCILTIVINRWFPHGGFSKESFKHMWGYGSKILGSSLINTVYSNLYTLVIGRVFSPAQVGHFNRGKQYALLPMQTVLDMALKVNFPILATMQNDNARLLRAYKKLMSVPLYVLYPILIGLAAMAEPLIIVMIGEKWLPCARIMQILCVGYMFSPLTHLNLNLLYVKARTDLVLKLELIKKPIAFAILFASIPFGIIWMVIGKAVYEFIAFSFNCYYTGKILDYGELKQLKVLAPIFINAFIMGGVVTLVILPFSNPWIKLCVGVPAGVLSYLLFSLITKDDNFKEIVGIVRTKFLKN